MGAIFYVRNSCFEIKSLCVHTLIILARMITINALLRALDRWNGNLEINNCSKALFMQWLKLCWSQKKKLYFPRNCWLLPTFIKWFFQKETFHLLIYEVTYEPKTLIRENPQVVFRQCFALKGQISKIGLQMLMSRPIHAMSSLCTKGYLVSVWISWAQTWTTWILCHV